MGFLHDQLRARQTGDIVTRVLTDIVTREWVDIVTGVSVPVHVEKRRPGRHRVHADNAERQRRYRERKKAAKG